MTLEWKRMFFTTVLFAAQTAVGQTKCPMAKDGTVEGHLNWCSTDAGFNEGAVCGVNALASAGISGLPAIAGGAILGNLWNRTNMMGATKAAFAVGQRDAAVNAAICCQIHNSDARACLENNRSAVSAWIGGQVPTGYGKVQITIAEATVGANIKNPIGKYQICGGYTMDTFDGEVTWGDGTNSPVIAGRFQREDNSVLSANHIYKRRGTYSIVARVRSQCRDVQKGIWRDESSGSGMITVK